VVVVVAENEVSDVVPVIVCHSPMNYIEGREREREREGTVESTFLVYFQYLYIGELYIVCAFPCDVTHFVLAREKVMKP